MLPLELFSHRNFTVANAQTFAMYGGIGLLGFFVTIYLQQVAGYSALKSGVTGLVPTIVMFALSARMGKLADRYGARPFLVVGPLFVAAGFALMRRYGTTVSLLDRRAAGAAGVLVRAGDDRRAADRDRAGRRLGVRRRDRVRGQQRDRPDRGADRGGGVGAVVAAHHASVLDASSATGCRRRRTRPSSQAKRRTFGTIKPRRDPAGRSGVCRAGRGERVRGRVSSGDGDRLGTARDHLHRRPGAAGQAADPVQSGDCGGGQLRRAAARRC